MVYYENDVMERYEYKGFAIDYFEQESNYFILSNGYELKDLAISIVNDVKIYKNEEDPSDTNFTIGGFDSTDNAENFISNFIKYKEVIVPIPEQTAPNNEKGVAGRVAAAKEKAASQGKNDAKSPLKDRAI
jgi:hypothetical protein